MHRKVYEEAGKSTPKAMAIVKTIHHVGGKLKTMPEGKILTVVKKMDDGTDLGKRGAFALRLYIDAKKAGVSTRGFWTRPAKEVRAEIEKLKAPVKVASIKSTKKEATKMATKMAKAKAKVKKTKETKKTKAATKAAAKGGEITRAEAAALVIKTAGILPMDEWVKKANLLYVENGGKSNLKESKYSCGVALQVLAAYGIIETTADGKIKVKK